MKDNQSHNFGRMDLEPSKWNPYNGKPVRISCNGTSYAGIVKEINSIENFVYLQPFARIDVSGDFLSRFDVLPMTVPYDVNSIIPIKDLDEFIEDFNKSKRKIKEKEKIN